MNKLLVDELFQAQGGLEAPSYSNAFRFEPSRPSRWYREILLGISDGALSGDRDVPWIIGRLQRASMMEDGGEQIVDRP
jgi:hypothetical protein